MGKAKEEGKKGVPLKDLLTADLKSYKKAYEHQAKLEAERAAEEKVEREKKERIEKQEIEEKIRKEIEKVEELKTAEPEYRGLTEVYEVVTYVALAKSKSDAERLVRSSMGVSDKIEGKMLSTNKGYTVTVWRFVSREY